ncbi:hypothetical protein C0Q70_06888 [Pomacea canaliculata]|uniref:Uncharacterized protein n=1 Tax=Pomacea canaliculata TaxID=400727 RepID=A0A2T7PDI3_POMCA|nr:hypothetical protein C0Q70_06888 [Pomacea canaliculata]
MNQSSMSVSRCCRCEVVLGSGAQHTAKVLVRLQLLMEDLIILFITSVSTNIKGLNSRHFPLPCCGYRFCVTLNSTSMQLSVLATCYAAGHRVYTCRHPFRHDLAIS